ncbi:unnamed protein product [Candidula unifasciata]|uniref:Sodium/calcium exchanger membrane region domain-containing protein n=1 Tax=Candidula unifasciata TaxID=100452 RepID=A0A8S3ZG99_9EUPU|nr:unnamed protein product [Candidula unifasciata]
MSLNLKDLTFNNSANYMLENSTTTNGKGRANGSSTDSESLKRFYPWRKKGQKKLYRMLFACLAYTTAILLINGFRAINTSAEDGVTRVVSGEELVLERNERAVNIIPSLHAEEANTTCIARSVDNFPGNFMTYKDTKNGGFVIHILIGIYMFAALAVVCDDYFVPSLEHICEDLGLQADVAGATFMAAGSSAPEFMTSVIGVFFAQSDVGVGTIVGSAVFNILFIIGVCGLFAGMVVELTWYPLIRDTLFYLMSVMALFLTIRDKSVEWYEAVLMVVLYLVYIVLMYFNRPLEKKSRALVKKLKAKLGRQPLVSKEPDEYVIPESMRRARAHSRISYTLSVSMSREYSKSQAGLEQSLPEEHETPILENNSLTKATSLELSKTDQLMTVSEFESVWKIPENFFVRIIWVAMCPLRALLYVSVPDSRRPGIWARLYLVSFAMSVVWISGLTYIMVWMVTIAGDALDIPDTVMGLTLLAAGTSVPDCLSSVFVARDGYGDMAVSNSLGSNVFDILMCLGLPWLIECIRSNGGSVVIDSGGLTYSTLTLLATVIFLLMSMGINHWKLTKAYGGLCLVVYVFVITLSCLFELNVFEDINPPSCDRL